MRTPKSEAAALASRLSDDPELLSLVEIFAGELESRVASLERAAREGDIETLRRLAHQLKGASAGYGFPGLGLTAGRVEEHLRSHSGQAAAEAVQPVRDAAEELIDACRHADAVARHVLASGEGES